MKNLYLLILFMPFAVLAQEESEPSPLVTDRPDQTEASSTVAANVLQIESGAFLNEFEQDRFRESEITYHTSLIRYGLLDNFELRLGLDYVQTKTEVDGTEVGDQMSFSPLLLGGKFYIAQENGWRPEISILGHLNLPYTVKEELRPEYTSMDFRFLLSHTLSNSSSLGYNLGARVGGTSAELEYLYTLVYGLSLTDTVGFYAEVYGFLPEDSTAYHSWNANFTYLFNNDLQGDASVGTGINNDQTLFLSAGISYRINQLF